MADDVPLTPEDALFSNVPMAQAPPATPEDALFADLPTGKPNNAGKPSDAGENSLLSYRPWAKTASAVFKGALQTLGMPGDYVGKLQNIIDANLTQPTLQALGQQPDPRVDALLAQHGNYLDGEHLVDMARKVGLVDRPDLAPQNDVERLSDAAAQGLGNSLGLGGALGIASGIAGGVGNQIGGAAGGIMGSLAPIGGYAAGNGLYNLANTLRAPFTQSGRELAAGKVLRDAASNPYVDIPSQQPLPGGQLGTGQLSGDQGLLALQKQVLNQKQGSISDLRAANNDVIRNALQSIGTGSSGENASILMANNVKGAYDAAKQVEKNLWESIDPENVSQIPINELRKYIFSWSSKVPVAQKRDLPRDPMNAILGFDKPIPLSEIQGARTKALEIGREEIGNKSRLANDFAGILSDYIDSPEIGQFLDQTSPGAGERWAAARNFTRQMSANFGLNDRSTINPTGSIVNDVVNPSQVASKYIVPGNSSALDAYQKATGGVAKQTPPIENAMVPVRDVVINRIFDGASGLTDANGNRVINAGQLRKFVDANQNTINSPAFSPAQRDLINKVTDYSDKAASIDRVSGPGSQTYSLLHGDKFLDGLLGNAFSKNIDIAAKIGGAVGGYLGGKELGGIGSAAGAFIGATKANDAIKLIYSMPKNQILDMVKEAATTNPDLARTLMMKATPKNLPMIELGLQKYLSFAAQNGNAVAQQQ